MNIDLSKEVSLIEIQNEDYKDLYGLMARIYPPAYQYLWNDDCSWYLNNIYGREQVFKDLREDGSKFYFVVVNGTNEGILKVHTKQPYPGQSELLATRLHRIYLSKETQGKGISKLLMEYVVDVAKGNGSQILWLDCMDTKHQALKYYGKFGFIKGKLNKLAYELLKDEYRGIFLMWKKL